MSTQVARTVRERPDESDSLVMRWVFERGGDVVTCEIDECQNGAGFEVSVVPHWDVASAIVEPADNTVAALRRHAEIASALRDAGWAVARRA